MIIFRFTFPLTSEPIPMMLYFDDNEMAETAKVVLKINPHTKGYTLDQFVERMKNIAYEALSPKAPGYISTYGFVLTFFENDLCQTQVKPSVSASALASYLSSVSEAQ